MLIIFACNAVMLYGQVNYENNYEEISDDDLNGNNNNYEDDSSELLDNDYDQSNYGDDDYSENVNTQSNNQYNNSQYNNSQYNNQYSNQGDQPYNSQQASGNYQQQTNTTFNQFQQGAASQYNAGSGQSNNWYGGNVYSGNGSGYNASAVSNSANEGFLSSNSQYINSQENAYPQNASINSSEQPYEQAPAEPEIIVNPFAGTAPMPGSIRELAESEAPEVYLVEPGDTLYDICDQLIDEPNYWPKLWALNPAIKNPHFIYPGTRILFYSGDLETPPYLEIVDEKEIPIVDEQMASILLGDYLPSEVVEIGTTNVVDELNLDASLMKEITDMGVVFDASDLNIRVPGFILPDEVNPNGTIINGPSGNKLISTYKKFYADVEGELSPGTTYSVLRFGEQLDAGYLYYYIGNVKIDQLINENKQALGTFIEIRDGLQSGDIIVPYKSTKRRIENYKSIGQIYNADAQIVAHENYLQSVAGSGHMIFLDKGTSGGINPGQFYEISQEQNQWSLTGERKVEHSMAVGIVRIIDATEVGAVGYIVKSFQEIRIGDRLSKG